MQTIVNMKKVLWHKKSDIRFINFNIFCLTTAFTFMYFFFLFISVTQV